MTRSLVRSPLIALTLALALFSSGCFRGGGRLFGAMAWTAIVTSAIVSSHPPPREVLVTAPPPAPRPGHSWQPGYWAPYEGHWVWVPGRFIRNHPGYVWNPVSRASPACLDAVHWPVASDRNGSHSDCSIDPVAFQLGAMLAFTAVNVTHKSAVSPRIYDGMINPTATMDCVGH